MMPMSLARSSALFPLLLAGATGCAGWSRVPAPWPGQLTPEVPLQVWSGGRSVVLRGVSVQGDTLRGISVSAGAADAELVRFQRSNVDSVRLMRPERPNRFGLGFLTGLVVGVGGVFGVALAMYDDDS